MSSYKSYCATVVNKPRRKSCVVGGTVRDEADFLFLKGPIRFQHPGLVVLSLHFVLPVVVSLK